jgi:large subunit ribosomal protein L32
MAALPKKKLSKARGAKRRASKEYQLPKLVECPNCGKFKTNHRVCPYCGFYKKRLVLETKKATKVTKVKE